MDKNEAAKAVSPMSGCITDGDFDAFYEFEVTQMLADLDTNADGALSLAEFVAEQAGDHRAVRYVSQNHGATGSTNQCAQALMPHCISPHCMIKKCMLPA